MALINPNEVLTELNNKVANWPYVQPEEMLETADKVKVILTQFGSKFEELNKYIATLQATIEQLDAEAIEARKMLAGIAA